MNMDENNKQRPEINQYAWILNYNAHVEHQHNHYERMSEESEVLQTFIPCELKFFDQVIFGSEEKQPKLIAMLKEVSVKIDVNSGRDWFTVYAGYRYYQKQLGVRGAYTDFFTDIEHLLPGVLSKIDSTKDRTERYQKYTVLLGREVDCWYMKEKRMPPINELTSWKSRFTGDANRFEKNAQIIIGIYKQLRQI